MRWAAGFCVLLSLLMMVAALQEVGGLMELGGEPSVEKAPTTFLEALSVETTALTRSAMKGHREIRILVLILLSGACGLSFASAARILRPLGLRREPLRKLLSRTAVAVAVLRTLDGAEMAGTMRAVGGALTAKLDRIPFYEDWVKAGADDLAQMGDPKELVSTIIRDASVIAPAVLTLLMVAPFVVFWRYFASERAREIIAREDGKLPS